MLGTLVYLTWDFFLKIAQSDMCAHPCLGCRDSCQSANQAVRIILQKKKSVRKFPNLSREFATEGYAFKLVIG